MTISAEDSESTISARDSATSVTLLLRVRDPSDEQAWRRFVDRYAPKIYGWCRRFQLQDSDAADVSQEVLVNLVGAMRRFDYDSSRGSFRSWLKTVTRNAVNDLMREWERKVDSARKTRVFEHMQTIHNTKALDELTAAIESEYERELLGEAERRVQRRIQANTWRAYVLAAVEQRPTSEVAEKLQIRKTEVYVAKSRVIKMLNEEVRKLDAGLSGDRYG